MLTVGSGPGDAGVFPRDHGMGDDDVVVRIAADGNAGTPPQVRYLELLLLGRSYNNLLDGAFFHGQPKGQGEASNAGGIAVLEGMWNSRLDGLAVYLCAVETAEVGDMEGAVCLLEPRVVARDRLVVQHHVILRVTSYGDRPSAQCELAKVITAADRQSARTDIDRYTPIAVNAAGGV